MRVEKRKSITVQTGKPPVNIQPEWYERFKAICEHQSRTPSMQMRELIQLGEKHYGLNKNSKTKKNNIES